MLNKVILIGNIGQAPELRKTGSGTSVLNLRIATNEKWKDKDGKPMEKTEWHTVVYFSKGADSLANILTVGMKLYVEGSLTNREYTKKDGSKGYSTEVKAFDIKILDKKPEGPGVSPEGKTVQDLAREAFNADIPF